MSDAPCGRCGIYSANHGRQSCGAYITEAKLRNKIALRIAMGIFPTELSEDQLNVIANLVIADFRG